MYRALMIYLGFFRNVEVFDSSICVTRFFDMYRALLIYIGLFWNVKAV